MGPYREIPSATWAAAAIESSGRVITFEMKNPDARPSGSPSSTVNSSASFAAHGIDGPVFAVDLHRARTVFQPAGREIVQLGAHFHGQGLLELAVLDLPEHDLGRRARPASGSW